MTGLSQEDEAEILAKIQAGEVLPPVNMKVADGHLVDMSDEEILAGEDEQGKTMLYRKRLAEAQQYLTETDYIASKLAEGAATADEYAEQIAKRQEARDTINEAQEALTALEASGGIA